MNLWVCRHLCWASLVAITGHFLLVDSLATFLVEAEQENQAFP